MSITNLNLGEITSVSHKGSVVESENVRLEGIELQSNSEKVFSFSGNIIHKESGSKIGTFTYQCAQDDMKMLRPSGCTVYVNNETYIPLQGEATNLLLEALPQLTC